MLAVDADPALLVSFLLSLNGKAADLRLVRSNPVARPSDGPAILSVSGPDGFVLPDRYGVPDLVQTWNCVAVHLRGRLERQPDAAMRDMLDRKFADAEQRLVPKPPCRIAKMDPDILDRMIRRTLPFHLHVETVGATSNSAGTSPTPCGLQRRTGLSHWVCATVRRRLPGQCGRT